MANDPSPWDKVYESSWGLMILMAMQKRETFYYGTVSYDEQQRRRARNRIARKTRKANRRAGVSR